MYPCSARGAEEAPILWKQILTLKTVFDLPLVLQHLRLSPFVSDIVKPADNHNYE